MRTSVFSAPRSAAASAPSTSSLMKSSAPSPIKPSTVTVSISSPRAGRVPVARREERFASGCVREGGFEGGYRRASLAIPVGKQAAEVPFVRLDAEDLAHPGRAVEQFPRRVAVVGAPVQRARKAPGRKEREGVVSRVARPQQRPEVPRQFIRKQGRIDLPRAIVREKRVRPLNLLPVQAGKRRVEERAPRDGEIRDVQIAPTGERRERSDHGGVARSEAEQNERVFPKLERLVGRKDGIPAEGLSPRVLRADEDPGGGNAAFGEPRERLVGAVPRPVEQDRATGEGDRCRKIGAVEKIPRDKRHKITSRCCNPDETVLY